MGQPDEVQPGWVYATSGDEQLDALGTWIWDLTADTITCSDEVAKMAGVPPGRLDGDLGSFTANFTAPSRSAFRAAVTDAVRQALPFRTWLELQRADGGVKLVRISGRPFRDADGHTVWVVGTLREVWADQCQDAVPGLAGTVTATGAGPGAGAGEEPVVWAEPHDQRSAVAAYRRVSHLL